MTTLAKYPCLLGELPPKLHAALERMTAVEPKRGPSVVVTDTVTGRFVQFYGGFGKSITLDVPVGPGHLHEPFVERIQKRLGDPKSHFSDLALYQLSFASSAAATAEACLFLNLVFELPTTAKLEVEELLAGDAHHSKNAVS